MLYLLRVGYSYIKSGRVSSLRCSARPDYIDATILSILREYGVKTIELGIQSTDDVVLSGSRIGHTAQQARYAMNEVKEAGFSLLGQMMTMLPYSDLNSEVMTAHDICNCGADGARISPTLIFRGTVLEQMALSGEYAPEGGAEELIWRVSSVKSVFADRGVPLLETGFHSAENLCTEKDIARGIYMPEKGEHCEAEIYRDVLTSQLSSKRTHGAEAHILVCPGHTSRASGQNKANEKYLCERFGLRGIRIYEDASVNAYKCRIEIVQPANNNNEKETI